jgi:lysophospholipase L1-like esterase
MDTSFTAKNPNMIRKMATLAMALLSLSFAPRQAKKKIVFFGDSITEAGAKPNGYIDRLSKMLGEKGLSAQYDLAGAGISGNKVYDLYLRMDDDVLAKKPDVVVIWIGVNDVWHKILNGTGTDPDKFERFYNAIIKKLKERNVKVLICTPATIGEKNDETNQLDGDLNRYSVIIRNIARNNGCKLLDLRDQFHQYLLTRNPDNKDRGILTTDGVHLNEAGNQFVADAMFKALF